MEKVLAYLNPLSRLGNTRYSFLFALIANLILFTLSEIFAYLVIKNPMVVGQYILFLNAVFVIYFSFRDGILGGLTTTILTIAYYIYIILTRHYTGQQLSAGIDTTVLLGGIYLLLSCTIGFLKQTIDAFIEKESNQRARLESILDQLPVGVIITNPKGVVEFINNKTHQLFGNSVKVGEKIGSKPYRIFRSNKEPVRPSDSPTVQVLKTKKPSRIQEFTYIREDGSVVYTQSSAAPVKNKKGDIIAVASIASDITKEKEHEERKDDFIKMASHELKTPLTSAKVFTQVLEKKLQGHKDKDTKELVARLRTQIDKLIFLVSDLLDVTRAEKGKLDVVREKFLILPLVKDVVRDLEPISTHPLRLEWTTRLPVFGDKERIRQVLTNLITNAIKYSPEKREIIIGSRKNKDCLEVFVKDFGAGIPKSEQKKIFSRFYQIAEHSTYPGLGLGLYISLQIVKQHDGKMWVESEKGKGSTFWFSLPIYKK